MTGFSARYVDAAGTRVYLQEWGSGPTTLCLHGLGGGTHFFAALGRALADRCRTAAFDFPGSGLSAASPPFNFDTAARLVVEVVRREGWRTAIIVGHSMGTIVALEAVRQAPDVVDGLVLVGGLPEPRPEARARIVSRIEEVRAHGMAGLGDRVVMANFARRTRDERPELTGLFARAFEMQAAADYITTAEALARWTARPLPSLARTPCLVVTGDEDSYAPPAAVQEFAKTLPAGTPVEVVRDCGHLPFLEQPTTFAQLVAGFVERVLKAGKVN